MTKPTPENIENFVSLVQARVNAYHAKHYNRLVPPTIEVDGKGRKYRRIVADGNQRMVVCFIDLANGDVLKAAGWTAPAKHARGNIFSEENGMEGISASGTNAVYLKH